MKFILLTAIVTYLCSCTSKEEMVTMVASGDKNKESTAVKISARTVVNALSLYYVKNAGRMPAEMHKDYLEGENLLPETYDDNGFWVDIDLLSYGNGKVAFKWEVLSTNKDDYKLVLNNPVTDSYWMLSYDITKNKENFILSKLSEEVVREFTFK